MIVGALAWWQRLGISGGATVLVLGLVTLAFEPERRRTRRQVEAAIRDMRERWERDHPGDPYWDDDDESAGP